MSQPTGSQSGATGIDPNAQSGAGSDGQTGTDPNDPNGTGTQSGTDSSAGTTNTVSREEYEAIQNRMRAADKRAADFEKKFTEAERAKMDETERTKVELTEARAEVEKQKALNRKLSLDLAFISDNTYKWKDADSALKLADLSGVEIGEDGTVKGLKEALKTLADTKKFLLEDETPSEGDSQKQTRTPMVTTGGAGSGGGTTQTTGRNSMESRFPQLSGRVGA